MNEVKRVTANEDTDRLAYISTEKGQDQWEKIRDLARELTTLGLGKVKFVAKER